MNPQLKKILLVMAFVGSAVLMAFLIYWVFFSVRTGEQVNINGTLVNVGPGGKLPDINGAIANINLNTNRRVVLNTNAGLPVIDSVAIGGLTLADKVKDADIKFTTSSIDGQGLYYYNREDGKFYRLSPDDLTEYSLSDQKFYSVSNVIWSPTKDKAILEYPDGSKVMYDFQNDKQYTLPKQYENISFAPSGREIAFKYMGQDEDEKYLAIANADGTNMQPFEPLSDEADKFAVNYSPTGQVVATYQESTTGESEEVYFVGKYGENFKSVNVDGKGFESQWAPDGQRMLYSAYSANTDYKPNLWVVDAEGDNIGANKIDLGVNTNPDKCTFSGNSSVICAVPIGMERGTGPFPELSADKPDVFYRIDLDTGQKTQLAIPVNADGSGQFQAYNIFTDQSGQYLYFTDSYTGKTYKIKLQ